MASEKSWKEAVRGFLRFPEDEMISPQRYRVLRRNIVILMLVVTFVPLCSMAAVNYYQYRKTLRGEIISPLVALANKTRHSLSLFLEERLSTVRFVASAYRFDELAEQEVLRRVFRVLKNEFEGFVDLGLIGRDGTQVAYAGPYALVGKSYEHQAWFQEVLVRGVYISDVFHGYRDIPHVAMAVLHMDQSGLSWVLRATIDTKKLEGLIASMGLAPESDAFLLNREGRFQTRSRLYGKVLEPCPLPIRAAGYGTHVQEMTGPEGRELLVVHTPLMNPDYTLAVVKPRSLFMTSWYALQGEMAFFFAVGILMVTVATLWLSHNLVKRVRQADERREAAFRELEHTQKLSSLGRMAAGVAHEINNPIAIINEKAGLMKDLFQTVPEFERKQKFLGLIQATLDSVARCKAVTHRLLGFARRMEVRVDTLDLNDLLEEVLGFLEKDAHHRNIELRLDLDRDLPSIHSDRGQLQQVFLNLLSNAFAAVQDGGRVTVATERNGTRNVTAVVEDNGEGMSQETLKHIFEPFFTTKKGYGTGLGLPITYGIIKRLGGEIEVWSRPGEGARFMVLLPVAGREA